MSGAKFHFDVSAFCALPLVRRAQQALVVALAIFILTLVVLREPFHGYLAEVHISGPSTAGLDLDDAVNWLKKAEPHLAAVATPAGEISAKCEIRATFVAPHPRPAVLHLDELADRWLYQYLPDRLQTSRRNTLASLRTATAAARQREDAAQEQLEALRQKQMAQLIQDGGGRESGVGSREGQAAVATSRGSNELQARALAGSDARAKLMERLDKLRLDLSHLLGSHTDEHPQIVTLKSQISALERQLGNSEEATSPASTGTQLIPESGERQTRKSASQDAVKQASGESADKWEASIAAQISAIAGELSKASRERQAAEQHLTERMQELSGQPTAAQWSAGPAQVVTRLGGTPRSSTLALAGLLAGIAGIVMFRSTATEDGPTRIASASELASVFGVPVVGNLVALREVAWRVRRRLLTPARLRIVTLAAESLVALAAVACLVSIAVDPSLGRQVLEDPFGTLSEVLGRFG